MADKESKEKMALHELKRRMEGEMEEEMYKDDHLLNKFLIARDYDVDKAEYMLRQHLEWRKKFDVKNISKYNPPEVLVKHFILTKLGYDKEGHLLKYNDFGDTDYRGMVESSRLEDWLKFIIKLFEEDIVDLKEQSRKLGKIIDKVVYIVNMKNLSLAKATDKKVLHWIIATILMYMDNYPETLHTIYVVNSPIYFNLFFSVLKAFLPNTVIRKIKPYSSGNEKHDLLEVIDADVLPMFLGGERTDPDGNPMCQSIIKKPEEVPKSYYFRENKRLFITLPEVQKITVSRGDIEEIRLEVTVPHSFLEWEFQLKSGDIKFGIFYEDDNGEKREIIPLHKLNTDDIRENGFYKCENIGTYIVVFDNSCSSLRSKEIYYKITANNMNVI